MAFLEQHSAALQRQGVIQAFDRPRGGRRYGPYFRVVFRDHERQRTFYLGRPSELVDLAREQLARLQQRRRQQLAGRRRMAAFRGTMRGFRAQIKTLLAERGLDLKGWELRGTRRERSWAWMRTDHERKGL
jgi:hypothetical protein